MKKLLLLSLFIFLITPLPIKAQELPTVVFINQVRGNECCDQGSVDHLKLQIDKFTQTQLPTTFTLRYDALSDHDYIELLKIKSSIFTLGGFLEITPSLAKDAGVDYLGTDKNWYEAQIAYLLGYSQPDRVKLIDTYMTKFKSVFGYYPAVTTAWMIDTFSLNYLQNKYGIRVHQITREQWGTDSYTLFGGPWHLPYHPSENWLFMPGNSQVIILRQTGSDPYYNYFDQTNAFTTQPNDYMSDGKDFAYFEKLARELLFNQFESGFLLLGLENSIDQSHQQEYLKQIDWVRQLADDGLIKVVSSFDQNSLSQFTDKKISVVTGSDLINQSNSKVYFINAKTYRARVVIDQDHIKITDLRIFSDQFKDPYLDNQARKLGYFVTPFIADGAHKVSENYADSSLELPSINLTNLLVSLLPETKFQPGQIASTSDIKSSASIDFYYQSNLDVNLLNQDLVISFFDGGENHKIIFAHDEIKFVAKDIKTELSNQLKQLPLISVEEDDHQATISMSDFDLAKVSCQDQVCDLMSNLSNFDYSQLSQLEKQYLLPELKNNKIDLHSSNIYINNPYRLIDGPPTRLVVIPRDDNGFLSGDIDQIKIVYDNQVLDPGYQHGFWGFSFFDIDEDRLGKHQLFVMTKDQSQQLQFYVAPNCKTAVFSCLIHPQYIWWNFLSKGMEKLRSLDN